MQKNKIKKLLGFHFLLGVLIFSTFNSCEVSEKTDKCKEFAREEINLKLNPDIKVFLVDEGQTTPAVDYSVTIDIYKEYCNGEISGTYSKTTTTDELGRAKFSYYFLYKMDNALDEIYITYTAKQGDNIKAVKKIILKYDDFQDTPIDDWGNKVYPIYGYYEIKVEPSN